MAPKSRSILFLLLSILVVSNLYEAAAVVGGWRPIDNPKDKEVVQIAKFAVTEHNKEAKSTLEFVTVEKGETQVVAGTNYRLFISAKDGGAAAQPKSYTAVVWSKPWMKFLKLQSFDETKG